MCRPLATNHISSYGVGDFTSIETPLLFSFGGQKCFDYILGILWTCGTCVVVALFVVALVTTSRVIGLRSEGPSCKSF